MSENKQCGINNESISSDTIDIPSYLPKMLIEWSKAAIRTYPSDILLWSSIYFRMKANGENPPVKPYLDPPDLKLGPGGLTPNCLKALATTLSNASVPYDKIEKMWEILSLEKNTFLEIIQIGKFDKYINPKDFIGISAAYLNNRLRDTMVFLCDTFSNESNGILLDHFVSIYQFLARLDCAEVSDQSSLILEPEEKIENVEENTLSNVCQSKRSFSLTNSYFENESGSNVIDDNDLFDAESTKGIPFWADKIDELESITDMLNDPKIESPIDTTVCDDPNFLLSLKQLEPNSISDDLLSLLSDSTIISDSDQSIVSFVSSEDTTRLSAKSIINAEEFNNEEMISESVSSKFEDFNFEEKDTNELSDEYFNESIIQEKTSEKSAIVKYEYNKSVTDIDMGEDNNDNTNIEVNRNFIVMLALVNNENGPVPNTETVDGESENAENESSSDSEFSLLERTEFNDNAAEETDTNKVNNLQTFDESVFINFEKESSDSEKSSDSEIFHNSEIDQQNNLSMVSENSSKVSKHSTETGSKDNEDRLMLHNESFTSIEHLEVNEEFEKNDEVLDENEKYLDLSKISLNESAEDQHLDAETYVSEEVCTFVLPGVGPAISEKQIERVIIWVTKCASQQNNFVHPHNLLHFLCPPLDHKSMTSSINNVDTI